MSESEFRWTHIHSKDELEAFYRAALPNIIAAAKECGYAIGLHGSLRRDLDLIAVPWVIGQSDKDVLAMSIHKAACGLNEKSYQWEQKPLGRWATSFPVCWTEKGEKFPSETNLGHIDLSVMEHAVRPEAAPHDEIEWLEDLAAICALTVPLNLINILKARAKKLKRSDVQGGEAK